MLQMLREMQQEILPTLQPQVGGMQQETGDPALEENEKSERPSMSED